MSEPQHPAPFGSHTGDASGSPRDARTGAESNEHPAMPLDSIPAVGKRLAQLRQAKSWSLDDVSARLKVSPAKLQALEAGDISQMPDRTFAAGIVRSYAKILGTDPAPFTQAFRRDGGAVENNLRVPASAGAGLPRARVSVPLGNSSGRKRSWLWGVAAIVVALVALGMWHTGGDSAAWLARLKSSTGAVTSSVTSNDSTAPSGAQTPDEAAAANTGEAASLPEVATSPNDQPMPRPLGTNALPASSSQVPSAASAPAATPKAASGTAASAAAGSEAVAGSGSSAIELKVKEDSWFSVRGKDGKEVFSGLVKAGNTQRVQGEAPFKVTVGNVKGVEALSVDDQPVDARRYASARGNVARLTLP
jgi:cytoskeleton protein RodZ